MNLRVGAFYMIRGGHILRYQGLYQGPTRRGETEPTYGPNLAFRAPSADMHPSGASIAPTDVLYEITAQHAEMLRFRRDQLAAHKLDTEEIELVMKELGVAK